MEPQRPAPPAKANLSGCFIAIAIAVLLVIAGVAVVFGFYRAAKVERHTIAKDAHVSVVGHAVKIEKSELHSYSATDFGNSLTSEHFVAIAVVDDITTLGKKLFAEKADGQRVEWMLQVSDISKSRSGGDSERIEGQFKLPYSITNGRSSSGSNVRVKAQFPAEAASQLVSLRKDDWVRLSGNLRFTLSNNSVVFEDAAIVSEAEEVLPESESSKH